MHARTWSNASAIRNVATGAALAIVLAACGGGEETPDVEAEGTAPAEEPAGESEGHMDDMSSEEHEDMGGEMDDDMDMGMSGFGEPAEPSDAERTIELNVDNDLAFEPADFEVGVGEAVTFRIANTGDVEHEFVLGDQAAQDAMAEMMDEGGDHAHSSEMSNAVTIHPGETAELTWRFTSEGTVLVGCHVPGHWESGMLGTVTVG